MLATVAFFFFFFQNNDILCVDLQIFLQQIYKTVNQMVQFYQSIRILDKSGKTLLLYHIAFFQLLPAHLTSYDSQVIISSVSQLCTINFLANYLSDYRYRILQVFTVIKSVEVIFQFYLHILCIFGLQSLQNTSSGQCNHFKFVSTLDLHHFHSY